MLRIGCWSWGSKYGPHYVDRLRASLERNFSETYTFQVWHPEPEDLYLSRVAGCFARLRTFDPEWQKAQGISEGDRIVCLDLDLVITGSLDGLFGKAPFEIAQGINSSNPCPYNGSVWGLEAGYRPDVWSSFSLDAAAKVPFYAFPDDQAWFAHMMPGAGALTPREGVFGFKKPGWPPGVDLPANARIVAFPGARDPAQFAWIPWVRDNWAV